MRTTETNGLTFSRTGIMRHPVYRVVGFEVVNSYTLKVVFDDGKERMIDFQPVLKGRLYGPLRDECLFGQVEIDPEVHTLVWPNGADFDPAVLHDWPEYLEDMKALAEEWVSQEMEPA